MSDLIKFVLTSSDAHLSYSTVFRLSLLVIRTGIAKQVHMTSVSVCKWSKLSYW